ncbi:MAG: NAD-dependent deacylase [Proteobacteria bacterium]|nr:NAD-dependent deacylase [Pseudomonadota bacterium]
MDNLIKQVSKEILRANKIVAMTGAGISVESGIPPFRGKGGLWEKFDPMEYAHIQAFISNPEKVWHVLLREMKAIIESSYPNAAHDGLARLEKLGKFITVITQNVDGLHQQAGNTDVVEFHGNFATYSCMDCHSERASNEIDLKEIPPRCPCGGIYRPDCVFFGETIPEDAMWRSQKAASECDLMLVIGTSALVQPASHIPLIAKRAGAIIIEINPEPTPLTETITDYSLMGKAAPTVKNLINVIEDALK